MVAAIACLALAGCASIPTGGPVKEGDTEVAPANAFFPILQGPEQGASPRATVQGFLTAAVGGSVSGFDIARDFLTPEASTDWDPLATVTVFDSRQVVLNVDDTTGAATYEVPVAATVDASGVLTEATTDGNRTLEFTVVTDADGESRISSLDDGIVMSVADFTRFYRPIQLMFASKDATTVVPETRWFPSNDQIATAAARELVSGPSVWLADAVRTGFPPGSSLSVDAVVVEDGIATVTLAPGSAGDAAERSLAGEQLRLTLTQLSSVQEVETTIGSLPLGGDDSAVLATAPLPDERAAVIVGGRLGYWDGESVTVTPASAGVVPTGASGLALAYDAGTVAMVVDGSVLTSTALADAVTREAPPAESDPVGGPVIPTTTLVEGRDLVAPSYDSDGWLWTTETDSSGAVLAVAADGTLAELDAPQLAGRSIQALEVSRDGARLAVLSRAGGGQVLEVMAVVRDETGVPLGLGPSLALGPAVNESIDLAWLDDASVATLGEESGEVSMVEVGGWTTAVTAVAGASSLTARNGVRTLLAVGEDGVLFARSGNDWTPKAAKVSDVAYSG